MDCSNTAAILQQYCMPDCSASHLCCDNALLSASPSLSTLHRHRAIKYYTGAAAAWAHQAGLLIY